MRLRIALDLDDCIFDFYSTFYERFGEIKDQYKITKLVHSLRNDKDFWENLPLLERPDFDPHIYSTKRINSKTYTRNNLKKYDLPIKPIYQMVYQAGNKANMIKGVSDILIDDSVYNVMKAINSGFPALLIDRPHNQDFGAYHRIFSLTEEEIYSAYDLMMTYEYAQFKTYYKNKTYSR